MQKEIDLNKQFTFNEAITVFKSLPTQKIMEKYFTQTFFETKRDELNKFLKEAILEGTNDLTSKGEIAYSIYLDKKKQIVFHVLSYFDHSFVMKLAIKRNGG